MSNLLLDEPRLCDVLPRKASDRRHVLDDLERRLSFELPQNPGFAMNR